MALTKTFFLFLFLTSCSSAFEGQAINDGGSGEGGEVEVLNPQPVTGSFLTYENAFPVCVDSEKGGRYYLRCDILGRDENGQLFEADDFSDGSVAKWLEDSFEFAPLSDCSVTHSPLSRTWCFSDMVSETNVEVDISRNETENKTTTSILDTRGPKLEDLNAGTFSVIDSNFGAAKRLTNSKPEYPVTVCDSIFLPEIFSLEIIDGDCYLSILPNGILSETGSRTYQIFAGSKHSELQTSSITINIEEEGLMLECSPAQAGVSITLDVCDLAANPGDISIHWGDGTTGVCETTEPVEHVYPTATFYYVVVMGLNDPYSYESANQINCRRVTQWSKGEYP